jgi:hypothetical protein
MVELATSSSPVIENLRTGLEAYVEQPPGRDGIIRVMGRAGLRALDDNAHMREVVERSLGPRGTIVPAYAAGLLRVALQKNILYTPVETPDGVKHVQNGSLDPFAGFEDERRWYDFMNDCLTPGSLTEADIARHLREETVGTTVTDRYVIPKLIGQLLSDRLGAHPRVLDIGCGPMHGLKRWGLLGRLHREGGNFLKILAPQHIQIVRPGPLPNQYLFDRAAHTYLWDVNQRPLEFSQAWGGDLNAPNDPAVMRSSRSGYYPREYKEGRRVTEFDLLSQVNIDEVGFYQGDFTDLDYADFRQRTGMEAAEITMGLTVAYEMTSGDQEKYFETMRRLTAPNGIMIVQEFAQRPPGDPTRILTDATSFGERFQYRTFVLDPRDPEPHFMEWFISDSGRPRQAMVGEDFGRVSRRELSVPRPF